MEDELQFQFCTMPYTTTPASERIELPVTMLPATRPAGHPHRRPGVSYIPYPGQTPSKERSNLADDHSDGSNRHTPRHSTSDSHLHPVAVDRMKEAKIIVSQSPRPEIIVLAAFPELFEESQIETLRAADGVVLDLEALKRETPAVSEQQIQEWIDAAYKLRMQVFAAGSEETLSQAPAILDRCVSTIVKTGAYEGLSNQKLANAITEHFQKMYEGVPRFEPSLNLAAAGKARADRDADPHGRERKIDPVYYNRVMTVEEEDQLNEIVNEFDR